MCGLVGLATTLRQPLSLERTTLERMRDRLAHRGPDDAGVWIGEHAALGHRRLAILDPTPAGHQPFAPADEGGVLAYNGELYNDAELRDELARNHGTRFLTGCDTETLWHALDAWGTEALPRLRGMFAFAWFDPRSARLLLARDPLGIKPLYWWRGRIAGSETVAFASEPHALFEHPEIAPRPDALGISAYLTTIRTVNGDRTLFEGVRAVRPGESLAFDLTRDLEPTRRVDEVPDAGVQCGDGLRSAFEESVRLHLRSDVPTCAMLSGGLDSSAICAVASAEVSPLHTYAAGARSDGLLDAGSPQDDLPSAAFVASHLGTDHESVQVDRGAFVSTWLSMIDRLGVPLSTPNETAIHLVCRSMRTSGRVVTLSGEGADELLGGYVGPMAAAAEHVASGNADPGLFQLDANAWWPRDLKARLCTRSFVEGLDADEWLVRLYRETHARCEQDDALSAHLQFHRRVNLTGLLGRLDTASMLASIEGRTPFADVAVAALCESLPMADRYDPASDLRTKIALRRAFSNDLPDRVTRRPKASFPLPFERWMHGVGSMLPEDAWVHSVVTPEAWSLITGAPGVNWQVAWPLLNIAVWGERWWGDWASVESRLGSPAEPASAATNGASA